MRAAWPSVKCRLQMVQSRAGAGRSEVDEIYTIECLMACAPASSVEQANQTIHSSAKLPGSLPRQPLNPTGQVHLPHLHVSFVRSM